MLALSRKGSVYAWGTNKAGALGLGIKDTQHIEHKPVLINRVQDVTWISCESDYNGCLTKEGRVHMWGSNLWGGGVGGRTKGPLWSGKLGLGEDAGRFKSTPQVLSTLSHSFIERLSLGSVYAGCCSQDGSLYMWGYGGHGNLSLGGRTRVTPRPSMWYIYRGYISLMWPVRLAKKVQKVISIPKNLVERVPYNLSQSNGRHVHFLVPGHKGVLSNLAAKTGGFNEPYDELLPYKVGHDKIRNSKSKPPISPFAAWPPPYTAALGSPVCSVVSAHIHCGLITAAGEAWAWGRGSNDGKMWSRTILEHVHGDGRPPKVDEMKCYMMQPHRVGIARPEYWKYGKGLRDTNVVQLASSRNHMGDNRSSERRFKQKS